LDIVARHTYPKNDMLTQKKPLPNSGQLQKVGIIRLFRKGRVLRVYTLENQENLTVLQSLDQSKFPDGTDIQATSMTPATF
jgi:hypothetical protein